MEQCHASSDNKYIDDSDLLLAFFIIWKAYNETAADPSVEHMESYT